MKGIEKNQYANLEITFFECKLFFRYYIGSNNILSKLAFKLYQIMDTIGSRIALYRNSKKWTQERLASELNILQSTLSEIENDQLSPNGNWLLKLQKG